MVRYTSVAYLAQIHVIITKIMWTKGRELIVVDPFYVPCTTEFYILITCEGGIIISIILVREWASEV